MVTYQLNTRFQLFALNSNRELATEMADLLGCELGKCSVSRFSDGEIRISLEENVRGNEVYVIQSTSDPVNEHMMELLIMIDALKRSSASQINVVIPYFGYGRQDRIARLREPITAKLIANLLQKAGATRVLTLDLHTAQTEGFFNIPVEHFNSISVFSQYFENKGLDDIVVVSPHSGSIGRARKMANLLHSPLALVDERKTKEIEEGSLDIIGNVKGKQAIIIDDLIDTGTTISLAAKALAENGAESIYACCTHPVLTGKAIEKIEFSFIKELIVTNTIQLPPEKRIPKIKTISVAPLLVEAIDRIHHQQPVSPLFE